jgi:hypothetical protein
VLVVLAAPVGVGAQANTELAEALRRSMESYDNIEFGKAERGIEDALAMAQRLRQDHSPEAARLYIFLGVIRHAVSGEAAAEDAFLDGLTIDRDATIGADYATPTLKEIMTRARARLPSVSEADPGNLPDLSPAGFEGMQHNPVETATAGSPIKFEVQISPGTPASQVSIYFRHFGDRDYENLEMRALDRTRFAAMLDGDEVRTSQIDYYIEATDDTGKTVVGAGGALSPLNIIVFGQVNSSNNKRDDADPGSDPDPEASGSHHMFISAALGSGAGLATGTPVFNPEIPIRSGVAPTPLHFNTELGFYLVDSLTLGAFMRGQLVLLTTGVALEPIFGGKLTWWFDDTSDLRLFSSVGGGYGFVRHTVDLNPTINRVDTTKEGPAHVGVGFGLAYQFTDYLGLLLDTYIPVLFPTLSVQADVQLGLRVTPF